MSPIPIHHRLGPHYFGEFLTSDDNLSLILRRLDEIERQASPSYSAVSAERGHLVRGSFSFGLLAALLRR